MKKLIAELFKTSNKKHLLITGSKGVGKSTLLKEMLKGQASYGGIKTQLLIDEDLSRKVILNDILDSDIRALVGRSLKDKMTPIISGFEDTGAFILNKYRNSHQELIVIDEIGFLEVGAKGYQEEIFRSFREKKLIAILRKEDNSLIYKIKKLEDVFIVDLDEFCQ